MQICRTANALNPINHSGPSHTELMGPEREVFGALMVTGIDGQSPGTVEAQFRFRGGHAHKFAINKCHFFCRLKRRARSSEVLQGGETRREDIRVRETEGERRAEQMTWCTFGRALAQPTCFARGLFDAPL